MAGIVCIKAAYVRESGIFNDSVSLLQTCVIYVYLHTAVNAILDSESD